jgi:hypothetical protein
MKAITKTFMVKDFKPEVRKKIKIIAAQNDVTMAGAIELIVNHYLKDRKQP